MAIIQNTYTGNGTTDTYAFTFEYLEQSHIKASINNVETTAFTLLNATTLKFTTPPAANSIVRIFRRTDVDEKYAEFYPGSAIRSNDLNNNFDQELYIAQELYGNSIFADGSVPLSGNLNMGGYKVINHGTPTNVNDCVTKAYVDTMVGGSVLSTSITRWAYTADATDEAALLTVLPDNINGTPRYSASLAFTEGNEVVFMNGAFLERTIDYTTNGNGTKITLAVPLVEGDVIEIRSHNNSPSYDSVISTVGTTKWRKIATAGQTLFSGTGDAGGVLAFSPNREQVYVNGILQQHGGVNYTASLSGDSVTFAYGLLAGDVVDIRSYNNSPSGGPVSVADIAFDGNVNLQPSYGYYINGVQLLNSTTLGGTVINSSLTTVGTITSGAWQGTAINATYLDPTLVQTTDTGTVTSTMILDGTIVNADINASAAIVDTKLATLTTANKVGLTAIDIDGGTDIGGALTDADLIIVDDGAGGTNRKSAMSRVADYTYSKVSGVVTIAPGGASSIGTLGDITINNGGDITLGTTTGTQIGTATNQKVAFYGATPVVQPTALTTQLTSITSTAPTVPTFNVTLSAAGTHFAFTTLDEGLTTLAVIANLQTRVSQLESKLQSLGIIA
jgi:hypothetical protein